MNNNEANIFSELIYNKLNSIENENKTKEQHLNIIKEVVIDIHTEGVELGRLQVYNHLEGELELFKRRDGRR